MGRVLTYGMVGGGLDAFIGDAHRRALNLDRKAKLTAGCFSRDFQKTIAAGEELGVSGDRLYQNYEEMAEQEANREDGINFVVIVTQNYAHYDACKAFLNAGFHVCCEKPLTVEVWQAKELSELAESKNLFLMVSYVYSGHVTAKHAGELIKEGIIGEVRTVMGEYPQGWLAFEDLAGNAQASWRCNPAYSGKTNALGDIGTHIENTVYRMTGLKIMKLLARMDKVVPNRQLDDNSYVMVEYENGATGMYWASQIALGHDNSLSIRIYGSKGSIIWNQENPEKITIVKMDGTLTEIHRGHTQILSAASKYERLPSGHTEGWFEAMANLYSSFIDCIIARENGSYQESMVDFPTVEDGLDGVKFVDACIRSSEQGNIWVTL